MIHPAKADITDQRLLFSHPCRNSISIKTLFK